MDDSGCLPDESGVEGTAPTEFVTREQRMVAMRREGFSLAKIGTEFGVSREWVRRILDTAGGPTAAETRAAVRERAAAQEREIRAQTEEALSTLLGIRGALSASEAARTLGIEESALLQNWPSELAHLLIREPGHSVQVWSDAQILETIREASIYEFPLTSKAYAELVRVGEIRGPSLPRIHQRFGGWSAACDAAGVEPGQTFRAGYESRWTDAELISYVRDYLLEPGLPNSAKGFDAWRRTRVPDAPSFQTVRNRVGTWANAKRLALAPMEATNE